MINFSTARIDDGATAPISLACGCGTCSGASGDWLGPVELPGPDTADVDPTDDGDGTVTVGGSYEGAVNTEGDTDIISVELEAGETYLISLRGTGPDALLDPFLQVSDPNGAALGTDDDGGTYINSLMTITATVAGTYEITAGALPATGGIGTYTVDVRQMGDDVVPDDLSSNVTLTLNANTFGFIEDFGEFDVYKIEMVAGRLYSFEVAGGADYNTHYLAVPPNELDTILTLFDADGNQVALNDDINFSSIPGDGDISSALGFTPETSGTYYLRVEAYESNAGGGTGGYALTAEEVDINGLDPLDAIDWRGHDQGVLQPERTNTTPTSDITVYFVPASDPNLYDGEKSLGWTEYEIQQAMAALETWADICDVTFTQVDGPENATFKLVTVVSDSYLGRMYPPDPDFSGANAGMGFFAINWPSWDRTGDTGALEQGADGWFTMIHEFGHGLGLAHPHDEGGGSEIMAGVTGPFDSYGVFDLNQGIYTTMSYNVGWHKHPDSKDGTPDGATTWGMNGTGGAFDIAVLQQKYGANPTQNAGDTVYVLPQANEEGTFYVAIWDVSGIDTIVHNGSVAAQIDLTAATLDYSPTGAGVVSFVSGIFGGFTIANGALIENATGGSGADLLIGNAAANVLDGRGGADRMIGGAGNDTYVVNGAGDLIVETETGGIDRVKSSISFSLAGRNVENLVLTGTAAINGTGNDGVNIIIGNSAANIIDGGGGADTMSGADGNDVYIVDNEGDQVVELADGGVDLVKASVSFTLADNVNNLTLTGSAANATGNDQANVLTGNDADNLLNGRGGADTMKGVKGDDIYLVDNPADRVIEASAGGTDTVRSSISYTLGENANNLVLQGTSAIAGTGNEAANILAGNGAGNWLNGSGGNDRIFGGGGNDRILGGQGMDRLQGDGGADIFLFNTAPRSINVDDILDFSPTDDSIHLDRSVFASISSNGTLNPAAFHTGTSAQDANDRIIYDPATGKIFYDPDGIGGSAQILFATVDAGLVLTHADFIGVA